MVVELFIFSLRDTNGSLMTQAFTNAIFLGEGGWGHEGNLGLWMIFFWQFFQFFREGQKQKASLSNDYYILSDVSRFILSHTNLIHFGAIFILPIPNIMASFSTDPFPCPFYPAQYIFPIYIQLLVPNLSINLSLNLSKNNLKFHPGNYQHLILSAQLWCAFVPLSSCMQQYTFFQYIHAPKHWCTLLQCIGFVCDFSNVGTVANTWAW